MTLLSVFEFLYFNPIFPGILVESISSPTDTRSPHTRLPPLPFTLLTISSYLLTHASSSSSTRAIAYANLSLNILLAMVENAGIIDVLCQSVKTSIRLCRQVCVIFYSANIRAHSCKCRGYLFFPSLPRLDRLYAPYWTVVYSSSVIIFIKG